MVANKHLRTLAHIRETPSRADLKWKEVEGCLLALGATLKEGSGSRVRISLHGRRLVLHKPHKPPTMDKGAVTTLRRFLNDAAINL